MSNNYEIYLDNSLLFKLDLEPSTTLDNIRKLIFQKYQKNFYFLTQDSFVRKKMEKKIMLNNLCQKNNIIKISKNINFNIFVDNENKKYRYSTEPSLKLNELKNILKKKIPEFYYINKNNENSLVESYEEMDLQILDIINNKDNDIHITTNKILYQIPLDKSINIKKTDFFENKKYIKILLNDKFLDILEIDMNLKLSNLRKIIEKKNYSTLKFVFLNQNKARIKPSDESIFSVSDSENEQKIFLKSVLILKDFQNDLILNFIDDNKKQKINYSSTNLLSELRNNFNNIFTVYTRFILKENNEIINKESENSIKIFQATYNKNNLNVININKNKSFKDVEIYLNEQKIFNKKINVTLKLNVIREIINLYNTEYVNFEFLDKKNNDILNTDEIKYTIQDILQDNKIYLVKNNDLLERSTLDSSMISISPENLPSPPIPMPIQGSKFLKRENNLDIYLYPTIDITKENYTKIYTILMLGETGSGKTALLNCLTNYLMNIDYSNDFRYKLIIEDSSLITPEKSTTKTVNIYNIIFNNILFKVIDTPGFGDTSGTEKDKETTNSIKYLFENEIDGLNLIGFVAKSSENKLTDRQQFIIDNILDLFGNDVVSNFLVLMTFYDGSEPQMAKVIPKNKIFKERIIPICGKNWFLTFNNSAMYNKNESDFFLKNYYEISSKNFGKFLEKLYSLTPISTLKSKNVLEKRLLLEFKLNKLNEEKEKYIELLSNKENQIKNIEEQQKMYDSSKKKIFEFYNLNIMKEKIPNNSYNILCKNCYKVCKEKVVVKNKIDINMNNHGLCKQCNCSYKKHEYVDYIIKNIEKQKEEINIDKIREDMQLSNEKMNNSIILKSFFEKEIFKLRKEFLRILLDIKNIIDEINSTALNIDNFETKENYLNSLKKKNKANYQEIYEINQILKQIKDEKIKNIDDFLKVK